VESPFASAPLTLFSPGAALQTQVLARIGAEIESITRPPLRGGLEGGDDLTRAHGLFWLWALGAYEVVRTMSEAAECFSPNFRQRIAQNKPYFSKLRMPLAKLEREREKGKPVVPDWKASFALGICPNGRGVVFEVDGIEYGSSEALQRFIALVGNIAESDIIASHSSRFAAG
jgi:hypothetical protein